jgi:hypothetical protein
MSIVEGLSQILKTRQGMVRWQTNYYHGKWSINQDRAIS